MDLSKAPPIQQKRIVEFVNNFLISTVSFLNTFTNNCEIHLQRLNVKLRKIEADLSILEAKLSSVPGLETITVPNVTPTIPQAPVVPNPPTSSEVESSKSESNNPTTEPAVIAQPESVTPAPNQEQSQSNVTDSSQPKEVPEELKRFFKMVQFGVPVQAVKLKMKAEGFDPSLIDS
ncbi:hypothetical protein M8J76_002935 [Diaphorina citri]|nr:hypothetical protein M8J75_015722 [Diaphorina citri]KAI5744504.1 hypothetical protein M8J76_002935 [Diaphorina citri]